MRTIINIIIAITVIVRGSDSAVAARTTREPSPSCSLLHNGALQCSLASGQQVCVEQRQVLALRSAGQLVDAHPAKGSRATVRMDTATGKVANANYLKIDISGDDESTTLDIDLSANSPTTTRSAYLSSFVCIQSRCEC